MVIAYNCCEYWQYFLRRDVYFVLKGNDVETISEFAWQRVSTRMTLQT